MKIPLSGWRVILAFLFILSPCCSAQKLAFLEMYGSKIYFEPPDSSRWELAENSQKSPTIHLLQFIHSPITDSAGRFVQPVAAIIIENVNDSSEAIEYSVSRRIKSPFKVKKVFSIEDSVFIHRNSVGYEGTYEAKGILHKVLIVHMRHATVGLQIICDSTEELYAAVEVDLRRFVKSIGIDQ